MHPHFDLIPKYFPELSEYQIDQFAQLWDSYHEWNAKINVISRKDIDDLYLKHVLHSLTIAKKFQFKKGTKILDVGTGGGFPGIPLSIVFSECQFTLVDSIAKKVKVVNEVAKSVGLINVKGVQIRAENINESFDIVVSRAVTQIPKFVAWVSKIIKEGNSSGVGNGIIYIKGGDFTEELTKIRWNAHVYDLSDQFDEEFFETKKILHLTRRR